MVPFSSPGYSELHTDRQRRLWCSYRARSFFALSVDGELAEVCEQCYLAGSIQTLLEGSLEEATRGEVASLLDGEGEL